jgi:hypothetical protein
MADEYESRYMGDGNVLVRDKQVAGLAFRLVILIPTAIFVIGAIGGLIGWIASSVPADVAFFKTAAAVGTPMALLFAFMFITGSVLRTMVSDTELRMECGFWGSRIPLDKIKSCSVAEQRNRVRVGLRFENGYWTTSYLLRTGQFVDVVWDKNGKDRRVVFTPEDPQAIVKAVKRASALRIHTAELVQRIDPDEPSVEGETQADEEKAARLPGR